jgi:hypothetical protein
MKAKNWMVKVTSGALCLSLLACGSGNDKADQSQDLYQEVSYERPEPAGKTGAVHAGRGGVVLPPHAGRRADGKR